MATARGCINEKCIACINKVHFRKNDLFCSKCGSELHYVCKKCHKQLSDSSRILCLHCEEEHIEKKEAIKDGLVKAGNVVKTAAGVVITAVSIANPIIEKSPKVSAVAKKAVNVAKTITKTK